MPFGLTSFEGGLSLAEPQFTEPKSLSDLGSTFGVARVRRRLSYTAHVFQGLSSLSQSIHRDSLVRANQLFQMERTCERGLRAGQWCPGVPAFAQPPARAVEQAYQWA